VYSLRNDLSFEVKANMSVRHSACGLGSVVANSVDRLTNIYLQESVPVSNQYLSTIDGATPTADDENVQHEKGYFIETKAAALLICGPEWSKQHFRMMHIDFPKQRWCNPRFSKLGNAVSGVG
jgi:hypothetical protein